MKHYRMGWLCLIGFGVVASSARAGSIPETFTLGRYVPSNVWMYIHGVHNPERAFIEKEWQEVTDAFHQAGIMKDVMSLVMSHMPDEEKKAQVQKTIDTVMELVEGIDWESLVAKEFSLSERLNPPFPEIFIFCRGEAESVEGNFKGLLKILETLAGLSDEVHLTQAADNPHWWSLGVSEAPYKLDLFRKDDVIALTLGMSGSQEVRGLMEGQGESILDNARFREALVQTPSPEDAVLYFDVKMLMENMNGFVNMALANEPSDDKNVQMVRGVAQKVRGMVDFIDYAVITQETDGHRELYHCVTRVHDTGKNSPIFKSVAHQKPFEVFDQYIPADATGYGLSSGIDLGMLYHVVVDFVAKDIPDGDEAIGEMKQAFERIGFDPERDVFSWLSGELITVSLPPAVPTPMGGGDFVLMIRVKDAEKARQTVDSALDKLSAMMQEGNQSISITPAPAVNAPGFKSIMHPMMAMSGITPVVGFVGEWLCVAGSPGGMNKCLSTSEGDAPSIRANERFAKEGLIPKDKFCSASFTDTSNAGQELGAVFSSLGMMGMFIPPDPETKPVLDIVRILTKLGPVMAKIDFFSSESSVTTFDGTTWKSESVITYKQPTQEEKTAVSMK